MIIADLLNHDYHLVTETKTVNQPFQGCYATDLLSQAIKSADPGNALITIISHENTVALAMMIDLPMIIITEGKTISEMMIQKANQENICILSTSLKTHEVIIDLYQRGCL
jgi:predicted transcriptional regulator